MPLHRYQRLEDSMSNSSYLRRIVFSYGPDWIITFILGAAFLSLDKVDGYRRPFSLEDTSLRHTFARHERVPTPFLYTFSWAVPILIMPLVNFITVKSWWDLHTSWLGLVLASALNSSITAFVKITVGRPRPDILDRCQPPPGSVDSDYGLSEWTICTQETQKILRDGFRSFPSGHASTSFTGLGFLAFYIAGKMHLFDQRGHTGKAWLSLSPFAGATLIAISRTMDYRHHWHDVVTGAFLGTLIAFFIYRLYYPSLSSKTSHEPHPPRVPVSVLEQDGLEGELPMQQPSPSEVASNRPGQPYDDPWGRTR